MGKKTFKLFVVLSVIISASIVFSQKMIKPGIVNQQVIPSAGIFKISEGGVIVPGTHGALAAWGKNSDGQCTVPLGNDFIAVAGGRDHSLALRSDGTLRAWGTNFFGQCNVPTGNDFIAVAAGTIHSLALRSNGTLAAWGYNNFGQCNVPTGNDFIALAGGDSHSLALRSNGTLAAWGDNFRGQCNVPSGNDFIAVAAGAIHSLALRSNGTLAAWGNNSDGQCNVPSGNLIAVAGGYRHSLALRSDGIVFAWGNNSYGQCNVPPGIDFIAVAGGAFHSLALRSDGTLAAWGDNSDGQCSVPSGNDFIAVAGGGYHSLAIREVVWIINASAPGGNGIVTPATQGVVPGVNAVINLTPNVGYFISSIVDNGNSVAITNPYVILNVTADHDVVVTFASSQYEVQASVIGGNGTVNPTVQTVDYGDDATINFAPDANHDISIISDNGLTMPITNPYMVNNVTEDHYVTVCFVDTSIPRYTVTAGVFGGHGTVMPVTQILNQGRSASILLQPEAGYHVQSISDNGVSMAVANPYFIHGLNGNHNVVVAFANAPPQVEILSPAAGSSVSGICQVQAKATDDTGIQKLDLYVDGVCLHTSSNSNCTYPWDANSSSLGMHSIRAVAYDHAGAQGEQAITVFVQSLILGIDAQRGTEGAWLIRKDYARIQLSVINEGKIPVARYIVHRKTEGGNYQVVKEISGSQLTSGTFTFNDAPLDKGRRYTYKFEAKDANGLSIAYSGEITI